MRRLIRWEQRLADEPYTEETAVRMGTRIGREYASALLPHEILVSAVDCKTQICRVTLLHITQGSKTRSEWEHDNLDVVSKYMLRNEPCAFHFSGFPGMEKVACGQTTHRVYVNCKVPQ